MKKQIIKDERVLNQRRKIQSDGFQIVFLALLASILIQEYVFKAPFSQYAVEFVLFITASLYIVVRNFISGNDIFDYAKSGHKLVIINSLVCGVAVAAVNAILNENLLKAGVLSAVFIVVINFLSAAFAAFIVLEIFYRINKKKQENIEAQLNDDENE